MDAMEVFYLPDAGSDHCMLDQVESNHCIKVLRKKEGDRIRLIDGKGTFYLGEITDANRKACRIQIVSQQPDEYPMPYELHIGIAPTKSMDRFEFFVEKATEIGVSSITPIICDRSERRNIRQDRLEKVAIAAIKQSEKAFLPEIGEMVHFNRWITSGSVGSKFIAHCMETEKVDLWNAEITASNRILIGPEGDFTFEEVALAMQEGFLPVTLGRYRLRTETAGIVACSAFYQKFCE